MVETNELMRSKHFKDKLSNLPCLERQEAQSERSLNHACPGDEIDNVNPFNRQRVRDNTFMKRISRSSNAIIKS